MTSLNIQELIKVTNAEVLAYPKTRNIFVSGFNIDSRKIKKGEIFIPLKGKKADGHQFLNNALNKDAAGIFVDKGRINEFSKLIKNNKNKKLFLAVDNNLQVLQEIANYLRKKYNPVVIGITGSSGKTTTKEFCAQILSTKYKVLKNEGNYNNEIGLPLTLLKLNSNYKIVVLEMAMRGQGQIKELCDIALPQKAVYTEIGKAHIGLLGGQKNIVLAKAELLQSLPVYGEAILNADDSWQLKIAELTKAKIFYHSLNYNEKFSKNLVWVDKIKTCTNKNICGLKFNLNFADNFLGQIILPVLGKHNLSNCLAAITLALGMEVNFKEIKNSILNFSQVEGRINLIKIKKTIFINDTYNANPSSIKAALQSIDFHFKNNRKIAVIGDMLELGKTSRAEHKNLAFEVVKNNFNFLLTFGEQAEETFKSAVKLLGKDKVFHFNLNEKYLLVKKLKNLIKENDVVLVKGSRLLKMEEVIKGLQNEL